jgi:hypothetical protein
MSFFDSINQGLSNAGNSISTGFSDVGNSISSGYNSVKNKVTGTSTPSYSLDTGAYGGKHRSKKYRKGGKTRRCKKGGRKYRSKRRR